MLNITGIILAAGQSKRMGPSNKLLAHWKGKPLLAHVLEAARDSRLVETLVVTGHQEAEIAGMLGKTPFVRNVDYANGMGGSLAVGVKSIVACDGVLILLGDMPLVSADHINELLAAAEEAAHSAIVVATDQGNWGNPVLFRSQYLSELKDLHGDRGARSVMNAHSEHVVEVEIGSPAARDFDTPQAFSIGK